uniref:Uncharacterized protein n=1 Tax=viral metagenome TaxID=1070528 RepID=A0A6C0H761_9ZZZZ
MFIIIYNFFHLIIKLLIYILHKLLLKPII